MKHSVLALVATLAASCTAPKVVSVPARNLTLDLPPGCSLEGAGSERDCFFTSADGRQRRIKIGQTAMPFDAWFDSPEIARATLREDPEGYWMRAVTDWEAHAASAAPPGIEVRRWAADAYAPPPGAEACLWFVLAVDFVDRHVARDNQGIRCALYDPTTDVVEEFLFEFEEERPSGTPLGPAFAADAERVVRTLRFGPPGARP